MQNREFDQASFEERRALLLPCFAMSGVFFVLPILGINAMFERKGWKYILINTGYWVVTLGIMGAIVSGWV